MGIIPPRHTGANAAFLSCSSTHLFSKSEEVRNEQQKPKKHKHAVQFIHKHELIIQTLIYPHDSLPAQVNNINSVQGTELKKKVLLPSF